MHECFILSTSLVRKRFVMRTDFILNYYTGFCQYICPPWVEGLVCLPLKSRQIKKITRGLITMDETGKLIQDAKTSDSGATITSGGKEKTYTEQEVTKVPSA
jgi:hypothetical protein